MGGLTSLLLLLCVGVTVSTVLDLQKRMEGGTACQRQYHVKLVRENGDLICGGSLLKNNWILTAAHCWARVMKAAVGGNQPVRITAPPLMYGDDQNRLHDIMLLQLPNDPEIQTDHVDLPDCPSMDPPAKRGTVQVAGHGPKDPGSTTSSVTLQCADMDVSSCKGVIDHPDPDQYMFCGKTSGVKICPGDSGGGVEYKGKIHGVIKSSEGRDECAPEAGFMNVCKYKAWIDGIIKMKNSLIKHISEKHKTD